MRNKEMNPLFWLVVIPTIFVVSLSGGVYISSLFFDLSQLRQNYYLLIDEDFWWVVIEGSGAIFFVLLIILFSLLTLWEKKK